MNQENTNKGVPVFRFEDVDRVKIDGTAYVPLSRNDQGYVFKREDTSRLAEPTIKMHVQNLCHKLGVSNRTQAALRARDIGLHRGGRQNAK